MPGSSRVLLYSLGDLVSSVGTWSWARVKGSMRHADFTSCGMRNGMIQKRMGFRRPVAISYTGCGGVGMNQFSSNLLTASINRCHSAAATRSAYSP